jgi:hypothetical protein
MQETFPLEDHEVALAAECEKDRTQALSIIGALMLDLEQAKKNLEVAAERQRSFVRAFLAERHIFQFDRAQVEGSNLHAVFSTGPTFAQQQAAVVLKPNGGMVSGLAQPE